MPLRVLPVLDLKAGHAVHAIGGQRAHYRPIRSRLHPGSDPVALARAFRDILGLRGLYLADLDAIVGGPPALAAYQQINELGLSLWVDAGLRDRTSLTPLLDSSVSTLIAGLETLRGPDALAALLDQAGPERTAFSLDLRDGRPVCHPEAAWGTSDPETLAETILALGVRRLILLDLARVGTGRGVGTLPLLERLATGYPGIDIWVGGGIASRADLVPLCDAGASGVLIGSALHDGRLSAADLEEISSWCAPAS